MWTTVKRLSLAIVVLAGFGVPAAQAQYGYANPYFRAALYQQTAYNQAALVNQAALYRSYLYGGGYSGLGANPYYGNYASMSSASSFYGPGAGYGGGYGQSAPYGYNPYVDYKGPVGSYLSGSADVINAQSQFMTSREQAKIIRQYAEQAKIDTRRKIFDERKYEQANTPTLQEEREKQQAMDLRRARNNPPLPEIWSGDAMNELLKHSLTMQGQGVLGPQLPLDEQLLKHINVTGGNQGNVGLIKDGGRLNWPVVLQGAEFEEDRKHLDTLLLDAVRQAANGPVAPGTLRDLNGDLGKIQSALQKNVGDIPPDKHIEARRYLKQLENSLRALQDPQVANYFNKKWAPDGKTVAELVKNMGKNGLRFAPAAPGDEAAYQALHVALVVYDSGMTDVAKK